MWTHCGSFLLFSLRRLTKDGFPTLQSLLSIPEPFVNFLVLGTPQRQGKFANLLLVPILILLELFAEEVNLLVIESMKSSLLHLSTFVHRFRTFNLLDHTINVSTGRSVILLKRTF